MKYTKQKMHKLQLKKNKKTKKNINKLKGGSLGSLRSLTSLFSKKTEHENPKNIKISSNIAKEQHYNLYIKLLDFLLELELPKTDERINITYFDLKIIILFIIANDLLDDDKSVESELKDRLIDYLNIDDYEHYKNTGIFYRNIIENLITDPIVKKYESKKYKSYVLPDNFNISIDYSTLKDVKFNEHDEIDKYFGIPHLGERALNDKKLSAIQQFINTMVIDFSNSNKSFTGFDRSFLFKMFTDNYKKIFDINGKLNIKPKNFEEFCKMMFITKIDILDKDNNISSVSVA